MAVKELKDNQDIPREYLATLINATPSADTPTWVLLGEDLEELKMDISANVETKKNILGKTKIKVTNYEVTDSVDPYYAKKGEVLYSFLENIVRNRLVLDECATQILTVYLWKGTTDAYEADMENCVIEVKSSGGDTTGLSIPFDVHRTNEITAGTYNLTKNEFTAGTTSTQSTKSTKTVTA